MPRSNRTAGRASRGGSSKRLSLDFTGVGKAFEPGKEYAVRCSECTLEEGTKAPYFNLKLIGVEEEYSKSAMYHRASTSESSLWRLRPLLEAFGIEVPEGPLDIGPEDFVDRTAMCSTYLDRYEGGSSVKPDEFWPLEDADTGGEAEGEEAFDLDALSDEDIEALAEAMEVKGRNAAAMKRALAKLDQDEVAEEWAKIADEATPPPAPSRASRGKKEEPAEEEKTSTRGRADRGSRSKPKEKEKYSEEQISEMNEDELEGVVEAAELDIDLSTEKTLRKKRNMVLDALEEAELIED
jgi:hypothetical protein